MANDILFHKVQQCLECAKNNISRRLWLSQIGPKQALWVCPGEECPFPFIGGNLVDYVVHRDASQVISYPGTAENVESFYDHFNYAGEVPFSSFAGCRFSPALDSPLPRPPASLTEIDNIAVAGHSREPDTSAELGFHEVQPPLRDSSAVQISNCSDLISTAQQRALSCDAAGAPRLGPRCDDEGLAQSDELPETPIPPPLDELPSSVGSLRRQEHDASSESSVENAPPTDLTLLFQGDKSVLMDIISSIRERKKRESKNRKMYKGHSPLHLVQTSPGSLRKPVITSSGSLEGVDTSTNVAASLSSPTPMSPIRVSPHPPKFDKVYARKPIHKLYEQIEMQRRRGQRKFVMLSTSKSSTSVASDAVVFTGYRSTKFPFGVNESTKGAAADMTLTCRQATSVQRTTDSPVHTVLARKLRRILKNHRLLSRVPVVEPPVSDSASSCSATSSVTSPQSREMTSSARTERQSGGTRALRSSFSDSQLCSFFTAGPPSQTIPPDGDAVISESGFVDQLMPIDSDFFAHEIVSDIDLYNIPNAAGVVNNNNFTNRSSSIVPTLSGPSLYGVVNNFDSFDANFAATFCSKSGAAKSSSLDDQLLEDLPPLAEMESSGFGSSDLLSL